MTNTNAMTLVDFSQVLDVTLEDYSGNTKKLIKDATWLSRAFTAYSSTVSGDICDAAEEFAESITYIRSPGLLPSDVLLELNDVNDRLYELKVAQDVQENLNDWLMD